MEITKELYDTKMKELGLSTYEELKVYRWKYSDEYETYIQSLDLMCSDEELASHTLNCNKMHEFYIVLVDMYYFGLRHNL